MELGPLKSIAGMLRAAAGVAAACVAFMWWEACSAGPGDRWQITQEKLKGLSVNDPLPVLAKPGKPVQLYRLFSLTVRSNGTEIPAVLFDTSDCTLSAGNRDLDCEHPEGNNFPLIAVLALTKHPDRRGGALASAITLAPAGATHRNPGSFRDLRTLVPVNAQSPLTEDKFFWIPIEKSERQPRLAPFGVVFCLDECNTNGPLYTLNEALPGEIGRVATPGNAERFARQSPSTPPLAPSDITVTVRNVPPQYTDNIVARLVISAVKMRDGTSSSDIVSIMPAAATGAAQEKAVLLKVKGNAVDGLTVAGEKGDCGALPKCDINLTLRPRYVDTGTAGAPHLIAGVRPGAEAPDPFYKRLGLNNIELPKITQGAPPGYSIVYLPDHSYFQIYFRIGRATFEGRNAPFIEVPLSDDARNLLRLTMPNGPQVPPAITAVDAGLPELASTGPNSGGGQPPVGLASPSAVPVPTAAAQEEEQKRLEARKREEEQRRQEALRKQEEEQTRQEALRKQEEEQKRQEALRKQEEEQKRQEALRKQEEEQKRQEALRKQEEEQKRQEALRKEEEEQKRQEALRKQQEEEQKRQEALRKQQEEEQKRQEALRRQQEEQRQTAPALAPVPLHYVLKPAPDLVPPGWTDARLARRLIELLRGTQYSLKEGDIQTWSRPPQFELTPSEDAVIVWSGNKPQGTQEWVSSRPVDGVTLTPLAQTPTAPPAYVRPGSRIRASDTVAIGEFRIDKPYLYDQWQVGIDAVRKINDQEVPDSSNELCSFSLSFNGSNELIRLNRSEQAGKRILVSDPIPSRRLVGLLRLPAQLEVQNNDANATCAAQRSQLGVIADGWKSSESPANPAIGRVETHVDLVIRGRWLLGLYGPQSMGAGLDDASDLIVSDAKDDIINSFIRFLDKVRNSDFQDSQPIIRAVGYDLALMNGLEAGMRGFAEKSVLSGGYRRPKTYLFQLDNEGQTRLNDFLAGPSSSGSAADLQQVGEKIRRYSHLFGELSGESHPVAIYVGAAPSLRNLCSSWKDMTHDIAGLSGTPRVFGIVFANISAGQIDGQLERTGRGAPINLGLRGRGLTCEGENKSMAMVVPFPELVSRDPKTIVGPAFDVVQQWMAN